MNIFQFQPILDLFFGRVSVDKLLRLQLTCFLRLFWGVLPTNHEREGEILCVSCMARSRSKYMCPFHLHIIRWVGGHLDFNLDECFWTCCFRWAGWKVNGWRLKYVSILSHESWNLKNCHLGGHPKIVPLLYGFIHLVQRCLGPHEFPQLLGYSYSGWRWKIHPMDILTIPKCFFVQQDDSRALLISLAGVW